MRKIFFLHGGRPMSFLLSAAEMIIGILLLINPVGFTTGIVVALGRSWRSWVLQMCCGISAGRCSFTATGCWAGES